MRGYLCYAGMELKRALKRLPHILAGAAALVVLMGAAALLAGKLLYGGQAVERIPVGVVLPEEDALAGQAMRMVSSLESVKSICDLSYMSREECLEGMENGELLGPYFSNWSMERYYTLMDRMNFSPSKQLWQLSKGEYMKMQTCFALAHHPRFLILDEPLEGFDPVFRKNFLSIMQDILNEDVGIFISSHITETLKKLADYLLFADNGIITFHCPEQMDAFLADKLKRSHTHIRDLLSRNS